MPTKEIYALAVNDINLLLNHNPNASLMLPSACINDINLLMTLK